MEGWRSIKIRDKTKGQIEVLSEREGMPQADVIHEAVEFVFEAYPEEDSDMIEPEGPEIQVPEERKEELKPTAGGFDIKT